jgi:hypothetical protein
MAVSGQLYAHAALTPGKEPPGQWIGSCVGPKAGLKVAHKYLAPAQNRTPFSLKPSRYTTKPCLILLSVRCKLNIQILFRLYEFKYMQSNDAPRWEIVLLEQEWPNSLNI